MNWTPSWQQLRDILCRLYPATSDRARILGDLQRTNFVSPEGKPIVAWTNILEDCTNAGKVEQLFGIVSKDYPDQGLLGVLAALRMEVARPGRAAPGGVSGGSPDDPKNRRRLLSLAVTAAVGLVALAALVYWIGRSQRGPMDPDMHADAGDARALQPLAGTIRDQERHPVAGARVSVPGTDAGTLSDGDGYFRLVVFGEREESVSLLAVKESFEPWEGYATLGNTTIGFTMARKKR
jgi:hypothetical protein